MLCTNRPEGFVRNASTLETEDLANLEQGPRSHLYSHVPTSCFLDTILVPLCTWLYLTALVILAVAGRRSFPHGSTTVFRRDRIRDSGPTQDVEIKEPAAEAQTRQRTKTHKVLSILYYLLLLAQLLMCILEITRLSLTHLGIGLLPFTFVALLAAAVVHFTTGLGGTIQGWNLLNIALWIALAVTNGVKIAEETKEGTGARKGSKYPVADEITDVAVMIGVYAVLAALEVVLNL